MEDSFSFTKGVLGWEEVKLLDLEGIRTLLALAWVAAGYLYELGVMLVWAEDGNWRAWGGRKSARTISQAGSR